MRNKFDELFSNIQREGREELLKYLEGCGYYTAPASTQHHLSKDGGLLEHSINVTNLMFDLVENDVLGMEYAYNWSIAEMEESIAIVGLFHDLGKASYYGKPNYVENILKSGKRSDAKPYERNKELLNIPHEVSSVHILSKYINLTEEETFAILYHNGLYTSIGYGLKTYERPLQMLIHFADMWASRVIEMER